MGFMRRINGHEASHPRSPERVGAENPERIPPESRPTLRTHFRHVIVNRSELCADKAGDEPEEESSYHHKCSTHRCDLHPPHRKGSVPQDDPTQNQYFHNGPDESPTRSSEKQ